MSTYRAPLKDYAYLLNDVFDVPNLSETLLFEHATADVLDAVLTEAARFAEGMLAPINRSGDEEGCRFENGTVVTAQGFKQAYEMFRDGGWAGLTAGPEHGGQGLPHSLQIFVDEMITSANPSFAMYRGLNDGAYRTILKYGSDFLKETYLQPIASGELLPTMNLTEPHCGSDLGLLRTRAEPLDDGTYSITGSKIFITGGEHDLGSNIPHLVLARLPDAPSGSRGISLFLVPKLYRDEASQAMIRNNVNCGGIEHKMGLKASATCSMNYDGAKGWLIGEPHSGLAAMFTMMNAARLGVGVQGVSAAEAAYQIAAAYARERRQGRAPGSAGSGPDPIEKHPDVHRMLLTQRAFAQGGRALALRMALAIDRSHAAVDPGERMVQGELARLLTPVVKSFLTDAGSEAANLAVQVLGGHGYIREWGAEQWVRDIRIASIYEGTNGIQALDLVGRKLSMGDGVPVRLYFQQLRQTFDQAQPLVPLVSEAIKALEALEELTIPLVQASEHQRATVASDYLTFFGLVALAGEWVTMSRISLERADDDPQFHREKVETAQFYLSRILPRYLVSNAVVRMQLNLTLGVP